MIPADATRREVAADAVTRAVPVDGGANAGAAPTTPHARGGGATATPATRFTTVAELDRASREAAARAGRREFVGKVVTAAATAATLAAVGWIVLTPESADDLHARIMAVAADDEADLRDARPLIDRFLANHASDPRVAAVRELDRTLDIDALERRARRRPLSGHTPGPLERDYRAAMARESESPSACRMALEAILGVHAKAAATADGELWLALVRRQLDRLAPVAAREQADDLARAEAALAEAEAMARQAAATTDPARRAGIASRRRELLASLVEMYGSRPHATAAVERAKAALAKTDSP